MSTGLFMLQPQVSVTVTREEYHQQVLGRYPITDSGYQVTAELAWCRIGAGKYRGQRGIEVRLGGERVGELTYAMSQRYGAMLERVTGRGYRPGCEAYVFLGKRGVEIELRLPRENSEIVFPVPPVPAPAGRAGSASAGGESSARKNGVQKPALIAAGVVGAFLVIGLIGSLGDDSPSAGSGPVANITTSSSTATSSVVVAPPVTTTTTTTTSAAPPPPPPRPQTNVPAPPQPPQTPKTPKPAPPPKNTPAPPPPPPAPVPVSKCDPNYSGCVPVASDVDCAGGSGNGPAYVSGPIRVIGKDVYGLDNDKDGIACE
jgi:hypothetical protein